MKKTLAVVLGCAMLLVMATPAFAKSHHSRHHHHHHHHAAAQR